MVLKPANGLRGGFSRMARFARTAAMSIRPRPPAGRQGSAPGVYWWNETCRGQLAVTVGTVFERSTIPMSKWITALFLRTALKNGVSTHEFHRSLAISCRSAWFMMDRLREALGQGGLLPMGGGGSDG
jgi:hypothetical protein